MEDATRQELDRGWDPVQEIGFACLLGAVGSIVRACSMGCDTRPQVVALVNAVQEAAADREVMTGMLAEELGRPPTEAEVDQSFTLTRHVLRKILDHLQPPKPRLTILK